MTHSPGEKHPIDQKKPAGQEACGDKRLDALRKAESQVNRAGVTFILLCAYLGVAAAATSHRDLVVGRTLVLPVLDIQLPVRGFYAAAPILVILLHLNLVITEVLFQEKAEAAKNDLTGASLVELLGVALPVRSLVDRISGERWLNIALRWMFFVVNVAIPLGVLLLLQAQFMPLHHRIIGRLLHPAVIILDLGLIAFFVPRILSPNNSWSGWWKLCLEPRANHGRPGWHTARRWATLVVKGVCYVAMMLLVGSVTLIGQGTPMTLPDGKTVECDPKLPLGIGSWTDRHWSDLRWPRQHLTLADDTKAFDSKIRLVEQDLRCADFSGLNLQGADLRGSDLRQARLEGADLRGADLSPAPPRRHESSTSGTQTNLSAAHAEKADFSGAILDRAILWGATLREARFVDAHLQEADLSDAELESGVLDHALLQGARLDRAHLRRASLLGARLDGAKARAADLGEIVATCASFRRASLQLSVLFDAELDFADLSETQALGANLRRASLGAAVGLPLHDLSLEAAQLAGYSPVPRSVEAMQTIHLDPRGITPERSDLEGVFWDRPTAAELEARLASYDHELRKTSDPAPVRDHEVCPGAAADLIRAGKTVESGVVAVFPDGIQPRFAIGTTANYFSRYPLVEAGLRLHTLGVDDLNATPTRKEIDEARAASIVRWACMKGTHMDLLLHRFTTMEPDEDNGLSEEVLLHLLEMTGENRPLELSSDDSSNCPTLKGRPSSEREEIQRRFTELRFEAHHSVFTNGGHF